MYHLDQGSVGKHHQCGSVHLGVPDRERAEWTKIRRARAELAAERDGESDDAVTRCKNLSKWVTTSVRPQHNVVPQGRARIGNFILGRHGVRVESSRDEDLDGRSAVTIFPRAYVVAALARSLGLRETRPMSLRYGLWGGRTRTIT